MEKSASSTADLVLEGRRVPVVVRVNRRARRIILRVDPVEGALRITAPSRRATPEALAFARERSHWILAQMAGGSTARPFRAGDHCPYEGTLHRILSEGGPRSPVRLTIRDGEPALAVGGDAAHLNRRLVDWLKALARDKLTERVGEFAGRLNRRPSRITVRDTRSRWGSCNSDRALSFSWRLILAPPFVLDYVAAHETAHLVHLNHSAQYWRVVASLGVAVDTAERWLNEHGQNLHRWGVEPRIAAA